ncbi:MAG: alpha-2-macroglobulin family protein [Myxococcota bacterium]|nr:alpha-2-macroglobulin family protein [Myxococcota bacterium]
MRRSPAVTLLLLTGCGASTSLLRFDQEPSSLEEERDEGSFQATNGNPDAGEGAKAKSQEGMFAQDDAFMGAGSGGGLRGSEAEPAPAPKAARGSTSSREESAPSEQRQAEEPAATRAWFPETFLFAPLIVTDDAGAASHTVTVPDRLTDWRILGLAHSADGALAGDVMQFQGTLPVYVDPVLPPFLRAGDEVLVPIQAVNTTAAAMDLSLTLQAKGVGRLGPVDRRLRIGGGGSTVVRAPLITDKAGDLTLYAALGSADAIERTIPVLPTGRPLTDTRAGSLAAPRTVSILSPFDADPDSARSRLVVYPGALAVLRSELNSAVSRGGIAGDSYTLLLAGQAPALLTNLGETPDEEALRELSLVATQRAIRHARAPSVTTATLLAEAALAHPDNPVLVRMGQRLIDQLIAAQRPDGTFQGANGWSLQRLMVTTADAVRAANAAVSLDDDPRRAQQVALMQLKASGAFERFAGQIVDPFTAASVLASGAAPVDQREVLRERVRDAIQTSDDGSRYLPVTVGVTRADGSTPSIAEATALAALALAEDPASAAWRADLGATLMAGYRPSVGWGDGRSSLTCLTAILDLFDAPLPDEVQITLKRDGTVIDEGVLNSAALKEVMVMESPLSQIGGPSTWSVEASPAVPGLGFSLSVMTWVPWEEPPENTGLELVVTLPPRMDVGQPVDVTMTAAAPADTAFTITQNLPAGVQVSEDSLQELVSLQVIHGYEAEDGKVALKVAALPAGEVFSATYQVIPTLSGLLHSGPTSITPALQAGLAVNLPPTGWRVF